MLKNKTNQSGLLATANLSEFTIQFKMPATDVHQKTNHHNQKLYSDASESINNMH